MRCEAESCRHNIDGYCECASYITIDKNGECDSLSFQHIDLGLKSKEEK